MNFKIGDIVSRKSYNNDCVFVIYKIKDGIAFLKGKCKRLNADAPLSDLKINENRDDINEVVFLVWNTTFFLSDFMLFSKIKIRLLFE